MNWLLLAAADSVHTSPVPPGLGWWLTSLAVVLFFAALAVFDYATRAGIIARATTKEAVRQPVFSLMMAIALLFLVVNTFLPFFSLGEDVKMLKDCGLATILISGLLLAVWTASTSVAQEIEGKTAMTLLSKPINRRQFIVGKYLGILQAVLWLMIPAAIVFMLLIYYKVGYDARESTLPAPDHAARMKVVVQVIPGIVLIFLEAAVLSAISVTISTRLPMIVNMVSCFTIFVVGHLTGVMVASGKLKIEFVPFMARVIATALPSLDNFNMQAAVATGTMVPPVYLGYAAIYCAVYSAAVILIAFILFEERDLA